MSHFSVSVIVPHDYSNSHVTANDIENCLHRILAPYDEQTEEAEYREFEDRTDEAKADYDIIPCSFYSPLTMVSNSSIRWTIRCCSFNGGIGTNMG